MRQLTEFQNKCENKLVEALSVHEITLKGKSINGKKEAYIHAHISGSEIEVWIYEDEAMISGPKIDFRFESPDFDTDDELIDAFLRKAILLVTERDTGGAKGIKP